MRKIRVSAFASLDGVMQAPGGPHEDPTGGFRFGGWVAPYFDGAMGETLDEIFAEPFDLLLGRKTYDIFAAHWPYASPEDPIGALFNRAGKFVATRNPNLELAWQNSHPLGADAIAAVRELKNREGPDLLVQGSTDFLQSLLANDLVDEITLFSMPLLLGSGKRLFTDGACPRALRLVGSKASDTGVVITKYLKDGDIETGSFAFEEPSAAELERRKNLA